RPIDDGATFRGRRLFGDNKTWRGVACAVAGGVACAVAGGVACAVAGGVACAVAGCLATVAVQKDVVGDNAGIIAVLPYSKVNVVLLGLALGGGATLGELPNSFVKRQLGIPPGASAWGWPALIFYVWDQ